MKVVTTFHASSSVVSSVKCCLTASRELEFLVVAKLNRIEVYSLQASGLQYECRVDVWGKVLCVKALPIQGTNRSKLVVMISHPDPEVIFLAYEAVADGKKELVVNHSLSLRERSSRPAEFFNDLLVHPSGQLVVAHCYTGRIKVIFVEAGDYEQDFDCAFSECNVLSMAILPTYEDELYTLAILHIDALQRIQLISRELSNQETGWELSPTPSMLLPPTAISDKTFPTPTDNIPRLIPVNPADEGEGEGEDEETQAASPFLGGVLVVGGRKLILFELASPESRRKHEGKRKRLDGLKSGADPSKAKAAKAKQNERDGRKRKPTASVDWPWGEITAWCSVDLEMAPLRFFLGDSYGALALLSLEDIRGTGLVLIPLGRASSATTLTYLSNQAIYIGSHLGDSQLVTISQVPSNEADQEVLSIPYDIKTVHKTSLISPTAKKGKQRAADDDMDLDDAEQVYGMDGRIITPDGSYIKVARTYKNIGPITDAVLVDIDGSGQRQLVTCSGGQNTGSLNVVRNGSEFQELATIPGLVNLSAVWAIKTRFEDSDHTHVVASTDSNTLIYRFKDRGLETSVVQISNATARDLVTNEPTLAFANVARRIKEGGRSKYTDSSAVVQVVPSGVYLLEYDAALGGYTARARFLPSDAHSHCARNLKEITAASINASQIAIAFDGGVLAVLNINETMTGFGWICHRVDASFREVSAISCIPANAQAFMSPRLVVAYWHTNEVEILTIGTSLQTEVKSEPFPALIRSIQLFNFGSDTSSTAPNYHAFLVCGLANGSFVHCSFKEKKFSDKKVVSLGNAPVHLTTCVVGDRKTIFAAGSRATAIALDKTSLSHSPVMLKDVTAACQLSSETFQSSLVLAGAHGLTIGRVQDLNKLNIRTIPFAYTNPRRIDYIPSLRVFAIGCSVCQPTRIGNFEPIKSELRLLDASSFANLSEFQCDVNEEITSLTNFTREVEGKEVPYICVGTVVYPEEEHKPVWGRLRIFAPVLMSGKERSVELTLVTAQEVVGCVYAVKVVNDHLVVAAESAVLLYKIATDPAVPSSFSLEESSTWYNNYVVSSLGTFGDHIVTGDTISTVSIIKVQGEKFVSKARDYGHLNPVAVEALDEDHLIAANNAMNLFTFAVGHGVHERKALERDGGYHVADFVTKLIRGNISGDAPGGSTFIPEVVFCTSSGRIGIVIDVDDQDLSLKLSSLQRNLANHIEGVGGDGHTKFRTPREMSGRVDSEASAFGFIDGDFLESFLSILANEREVEEVCAGSSEPERLTLPAEDYRKVLETLQSLH